MGGRIIVQQGKILKAERSWTNPMNALQQAIHYSFINFRIYCFSLWHGFFAHYALRVEKKSNNMILIISVILTYFGFFGRGDVSPTHSELCRCVSGS